MIYDIKPSDSQLLFYKSNDGLFLNWIRRILQKESNVKKTKVAYIGASNKDDPQFYDIFEVVMEQIDINNS